MKIRPFRSPSLPSLRTNDAPSLPSRSAPTSPVQTRNLPPRPSVPTPEQLQAGKNNLKPTDYGVVHPDLQGIRTRRDSGQAGHQFADFTSDVRHSTGALMSQPNGNRLMTELNGRTQAVNPGLVGTQNKPLTVADVYSGRNASIPNANAPRYDGTYAGIQKAYRYDGTPGAGLPSTLKYDERFNEQNPGARFNSLGHESVHAWRNANGVAVSPLEVSPRRNDPLIQNNPPIVGQVIGHRAHMQEEFETVGMKPTPHTPNRDGWAPNENLIRQEHGLPLRNNYSGETPAKVNELTGNINQGLLDQRSWATKMWDRNPEPPLQPMIDHLEK
ncbi:M91 family zinc metallopeptidase [Vitiosangium sp. GDMCC 1.1324]|uniref:M91 family zinc metallopeptidase n=1 Tax=Vitiosangium sp. (strain GDMCC 1.1324) TaxID=2138576 RepID=UPI000D36BAF1|nr:M91 family zinc metallopeptidase [Vitiosangium sp. GDMCC 1.1324]PTL76613.1 hypothetical protein DAT35_49280 [Vitiosangium sp. GDMCC 1.1324]